MTERDAIQKAFGMALRSLRRRAGLSQEKLANEGFARSHVSKMERFLVDPKLSTLFQLASVFRISPVAVTREIERHYARIIGSQPVEPE